ncbi:hypothetical protein JIG36_45055 [Actinoplanes sp. LDG1-06]|uniref:Alpha/beta hydrolase n=1 Tax=Paractinoplanes ovalisporus TaxID=2810368 RepID=A0ABS2AS52_9ACTN|nr:hypothetical protein [Actinoplanes ovalisporus]MBM2622692.1 hypothetical protein [Actinoplanes ovalisporus]
MRIGRIVAASVAVLVGAGLLTYGKVQAQRPVSVAPSGGFAVGRIADVWTDRSRTDQFAPIGGTPRVLSAWVWYPAAPDAAEAPGEPVPESARAGDEPVPESARAGDEPVSESARTADGPAARDARGPEVADAPGEPGPDAAQVPGGPGPDADQAAGVPGPDAARAPGADSPESAYAPGEWAALHRYGWAVTAFDRVHTGTRDDAPMADGSFPVVVLLPDLGYAAPQYAAVAAGLAARGNVVVGLTPTYSSRVSVINEQRVVASAAGSAGDREEQLVSVWAADARFAAQRAALQFGNHANGGRIAYAGHGLGGSAAIEACRVDGRCAAAVSLDGDPRGLAVRDGFGRPLLQLSSSSDSSAATSPSAASPSPASPSPGSPSAASPSPALPSAASPSPALPSAAPPSPALPSAASPSVVLRPVAGGRSYVISGAGHLSFTDYAAYRVAAPLRWVLPLGSLDGRRALAITVDYAATFLAATFGGVTWVAPPYPEVRRADMLSR